MNTEEAIQRITNLAQENNINWLGKTNIEAMKILLKELNPTMEEVFDKVAEISKECGFDPDQALKDYRDMEKKSLIYDEIYNRVEKELEILPVNEIFQNNDLSVNLYAKGMYDAFNTIKHCFEKVPENKEIENLNHIISGKDCVIETQAHNEEALMKELDLKNKMIDAMSSTISRLYMFTDERAEEVRQYFKEKVEVK